MDICILDGYTLNPGDLSWDRLSELGKVCSYDRTPSDLIMERARAADIILTNKTPLRRETLEQLPNLRYIGVLATGFDVVDVQAAKERGIIVTNIPNYGTASVAQLVFALLLELCHHAQSHSDAVMKGQWGSSPDWCFWNHPLVELSGKTIGIVGFGRIGLHTARIASAFGMRIMATGGDRSRTNDLPDFQWAELPELMSGSDVVSLHCPLTPETEGIINASNLSLMKRSAFLINTSRGKLVSNNDLAEALNGGVIAGAGLDVLDIEPPMAHNPLLQARNCIITPHIAWATKEARSRLLDMAVDNLKAFAAGSPRNVVLP